LETTFVMDDEEELSEEDAEPLAPGADGVNPREQHCYYISKYRRVYDVRREPPFPCFNCGSQHWRFQCPSNRGISMEDEIERSSCRNENGVIFLLGSGYVAGLDNVRNIMREQYGIYNVRVANENSRFVSE
jgi:hypothetical protein